MQWLLIAVLAFDLAAVKTEPNLERRSERALDNAGVALAAAHDSYSANDLDKTQSDLDELMESVDLAFDSLKQTGKDPRNNKFFKRAELKTRELVRRLEGMRESLNVADRPLLDKAREHVSEVHDRLLEGIMNRKHKED